jgi:hypothetical protein
MACPLIRARELLNRRSDCWVCAGEQGRPQQLCFAVPETGRRRGLCVTRRRCGSRRRQRTVGRRRHGRWWWWWWWWFQQWCWRQRGIQRDRDGNSSRTLCRSQQLRITLSETCRERHPHVGARTRTLTHICTLPHFRSKAMRVSTWVMIACYADVLALEAAPLGTDSRPHPHGGAASFKLARRA